MFVGNSKTNSDYQWMKTVMAKGTVSDKVAAYTVLIQDDPICNLSTIQNLISMVKVGKKKECVVVIGNIFLKKKFLFLFFNFLQIH